MVSSIVTRMSREQAWAFPRVCALSCVALAVHVGCGDSSSDEPESAGLAGASAAGKGGSEAGKGGTSAAAANGGSTATSHQPAVPTVPPEEGWPLAEADRGEAWPSDCEQFYSFRAHGAQTVNDESAYDIPKGSEYYASFFFTAPWGESEVQALEFRPRTTTRRSCITGSCTA